MRAVGAPHRRPVGGAGRVREVARVPLLRGHGEDLAARLEQRALAAGRERCRPDLLRDVRPVRLGPGKIAVHGDRHHVLGAGMRVEQVDRAVLLEHERAACTVERLDVGVLEVRDLRELLRRRIVRPHVHCVVAVGQKVDAIGEPHRIDVRGARVVLGVRERRLGQRLEVQNNERRVLPAAVVAEFYVPAVHTIDDEMSAVRRVCAAHRHRFGDLRGQSTGGRHRPEVRVRHRRGVAVRRVEHARTVRRPSARERRCRMPGEAPRLATRGCHQPHLRRAGARGGERDPLAVGREVRIALDGRRAGESRGDAAVAAHDPEIAAVGEGDLRGGERGLPEQARAAGLRTDRRRVGGDEEDE